MHKHNYTTILLSQEDTFATLNLSCDDFFFNQNAHLFQQNPTQLPLRFYLVHQKTQQIVAKCSFFISQSEALSPYRASFGGIECNSQLSPKLLLQFIQEIEQHLKAKAIESISLKMYPNCYAPEANSLVQYALLQLNYQITCADLNYHVPISDQGFETNLHLSKKRVLKKSQATGFHFQQVQKPDIATVHQFIADARVRKDYPISLSLEAFQDLVNKFPERFLFFEVQSPKQKSAAWGVTITINQHILYHFYPADSGEFTKYSPLVLLNEGLYKYAQTSGFKILDLGIATDKGQLNEGLARFKTELGAEKSLKLTFSKKLVK